jgi:hypothetical protein
MWLIKYHQWERCKAERRIGEIYAKRQSPRREQDPAESGVGDADGLLEQVGTQDGQQGAMAKPLTRAPNDAARPVQPGGLFLAVCWITDLSCHRC